MDSNKWAMLTFGSSAVYIKSCHVSEWLNQEAIISARVLLAISSGKNITALVLCGHADEMSESRQTHVTLHDIDPQALEQLVQYAYTAEIVVGEGNVQVG